MIGISSWLELSYNVITNIIETRHIKHGFLTSKIYQNWISSRHQMPSTNFKLGRLQQNTVLTLTSENGHLMC